MNKDTNKQAAEKLFASTAHNVLFANPKGEFFTSENIGSLSLKPGQKLEKFERTPEKEEAAISGKKELNANASIAFIKVATSLEAIKPLETDERKSVKEAYDKKVLELTAAIDVVGATDGATETQNGNKDTEDQK